MKRFLLAPDSFKGTMTAAEICEIWETVIKKHIPDATVMHVPMADGGEGMVDSYLNIIGGECVPVTVSGPFGAGVDTFYGRLPDGAAVMEMAACAGLPLVGENKDPFHASTRGVGEMICHAAASGATRILLGIGGSATNDCGVGMAGALGYRFLDAAGNELEPLACNMGKVAHIERPAALPQVSITVACDVDNPLYGPTGATYTFGRQKGATDETMPVLDEGLKNMARVIANDLSVSVAALPGAGAAGGLGAGLVSFLGARLMPGIDLLLDAAGFDCLVENTDIVFTGEGRIDWQSAHGKVPVGVGRRAKKGGVPCIALCGSIGKGAEAVYEQGVTAIFSAVRGACTMDDIEKTCREDMAVLTDSVLRLLLLGQ